MTYVITCGDEGIQINEGRRLGFVGAGFRVPHFPEIVLKLKELFGKKITVVSHDESDWMKDVLGLNEWDQANASMQQHIEALADREKLLYAGHVPFSDPQALLHGIKGHMVRPHGIHVGSKICFTLAGGEQKYNLGCYLISADWVSLVDKKIAKEVIETQVEFYKKIAKKDLKIGFEMEGELGEEVAQKNRSVIEKLGFKETE